MRDYSVITPAFWIGETGKKLRGDGNAQLLAMYLMTSPHSTMTGVFHCPVLYMAHETGMTIEGATKALARLLEVGFCEYEESSETVFVVRMASFQIADTLKPNDNRIIGLKKEVAKMASALMKARFLAIYSVAFCLISVTENTASAIAPSKPLRSQEQEQEQEQDKAPSPSASSGSKGSRLPKDWILPGDWKTWAETERDDLDATATADAFRDFWISKPGKDGLKLDWQATWRNWCRSQKQSTRPVVSRSREAFV